MEGNRAPAGWYVDPDDEALQRFWNGSRWTNSRMPRGEGVPLEGEAVEQLPPASRYASDQPEAPAAKSSPETGLPPAAWYEDPENAEGMRYWDGRKWTENRTDYIAAPTKAKPKANEGMVMAGYLTSFLLPIAGVVIGVILVSRENRHGRWIIGLSILFLVVFFVIGNTVEVDENP